MKDFRVEAVPRVSAETAIELVNRQQMQTRAWRVLFEEEKMPLADQVTIIVVASQSFTWEGNAPTTQTSKAVSLFLETSQATADRKVRDLEHRYLRQDQSEENYKVHHWRLKNLEVAQKLELLAQLHRKIEKTIIAQLEDPENPDAGREIVPEAIYFNVVANHVRYLNQKEGK